MIEVRDEPYDFNRALDAIEPLTESDLPIRLEERKYSDFEAHEFAQRYARLRRLLDDEEIDAVILTQEENVRYFTGYLSVLWTSKFRPLMGVVTRDTALPSALVVSGQERGNAEISSWVTDVAPFPPQEPPIPYLVKVLKERNLHKGRIGIELGFGQRLGMSQVQFQELLAALPGASFVDATPLFETVRMLKSDAEIERVGRACEISCRGVEAGWRALKPGMSEREILSAIASVMFEHGAEVGTKPSFFGILAGERWQLANAVASEYRVKAGDFILVDGGASYRGYGCDFIRQARIGKPSAREEELFEIITAATQASIDKVQPGISGSAVYDAALSFLAERKLDGYNRMNIIGHGVGADVHELPWLGADGVFTADVTLRKGMILAVEPGIMPPENDARAHLIVEDIVAVTDSGAKILTSQLSRDLWVADSA